MSLVGLGRVKTLLSFPISVADIDLGTKGACWHASGRLSASLRDGTQSALDQARIAVISGPMPMMFITRVRL